MSRVFIDASALMEIMMGRSKMEQVSKILHTPEHEFFVSALTVHILYYFAEVEGVSRDFVHELTDLGFHLPISEKTIALAQKRYTGKDFEDCLQAACAELGGCDDILTLDKNFARISGTKLKARVL
jgi:predicted nucleic acid-binding protein